MKRKRSVRRRRIAQPQKRVNPNYRPPDYKPSWNPEAICPVCDKKIGLKYMSAMHKGSDNEYHYGCLNEAELRRRLEEIGKKG